MKPDVNVVFLDNHLLVLNKPPGLLTQPSPVSEESLETKGKGLIKEKFHKPGNVFCEAVHRIDRSASGLVLFARTSKALSRLKQSLRDGLFCKEYLAVVEGTFSEKEGELQHYLTHEEHHAKAFDTPIHGAKHSLLKYTVIKSAKSCTLLHIFLFTGRYHQIRAQFSAVGHPIVGDKKYGSHTHLQTIALHHYQLQIPHPISGQKYLWKAPFFDTWDPDFFLN